MASTKEAQKEAEAAARASFGARLRAAFLRAGRLQANGEPDRAWLADEVGISVQAVGQALDSKKPNVFSAYTNEKAAMALGVDPYWLATGEAAAHTTDPDAMRQMVQLLQDIADTPEDQRQHAIIAAIRAVASVTSGTAAALHGLNREAPDAKPKRARRQGREMEPK